MEVTFKANERVYQTSRSVWNVFLSILPDAEASADYSAVSALMALGVKTGQIVEVVG